MDQLALTACVVLGIAFGFAVARFLGKGAMAALEAKAKAEAQREAAGLSEKVAAKEARLVELTRDNLDAKRRLEEALDHAARLNGAQQQFDAQLTELKRQTEEKVALVNRANERALEALRGAHEEKSEQAEKYAIELAARAETAKEEAEALRDEVSALRAEQAEAEARVTAAGDAQAKLEQTLRAISAESFHQNNQAFVDLARATFERLQDAPKADAIRQQSIDEAVRPLRDALARIAGAIAGMERDRSAVLSGLSDQVASLLSTQQQIQTETQGLAAVLRAPSPRGHWGEMQLRRVVELAGMVEHCDFEPAGSPATLAIHLPNRRSIAVDAAVPLTAFLGADDAPGSVRTGMLREHAATVRQHVARLSSPEYRSLFEEAPELVVAFLPGDGPFSAALEYDGSLLEFGAANNVVLATPATLIALLRAAAHGWKQYQLTENAREINALGQALFESLSEYQARMDDVRGNLERTVESYNAAAGTFETRILGPVRRFKAIEPPAPAQLRPRAIPVPAPPSIPAPAALTVAPPQAPVFQAASFDTAPEPFEPAAAQPAPAPDFEGESGFNLETAFEDVFDFEDDAAEIEFAAEPVSLAELEPVAAEPSAQEPDAQEQAASHPEPAAPGPAESSEPASPAVPPAAALAVPVADDFATPPAPEADVEPEFEPEPELVSLAFAELGIPEIEIDEPTFPEFGPNLVAMASNVARTPAPPPPPAQVPPTPPTPALSADAAQAVEGSGFFTAFVKI